MWLDSAPHTHLLQTLCRRDALNLGRRCGGPGVGGVGGLGVTHKGRKVMCSYSWFDKLVPVLSRGGKGLVRGGCDLHNHFCARH